MDKDRDELLNELIKYYDTDKKTEESGSGGEDMDATRIVRPAAPRSEDSGDTIAIRTGDTIAVKTDEQVTGDTVAVPKAVQGAAGDTITVKVADTEPEKSPQIPRDEVLGHMGLDGLPIAEEDLPVPEQEEEAAAEYEDRYEDRYYDDENYDDGYDDDGGEEYAEPGRGIWYALKPLWATMIVCALIAGGIGFYMTDNGIIGTYKRNFEYNMNMIMDAFGIYLDEPVTEPVESLDVSTDTEDFEDGVVAQSEVSSGNQANGITDNVREDIPSQYRAVEKESYRFPFADAGNSGFAVYGSGVVCAKSDLLSYITASGKQKWEITTSVRDPLLSVSGDYIALAQDGGTRLSLYKGEELLFSLDAENNIRSCDVSDRGDVVLVTERTAYKGAVAVYNRRGEEIFSWASGVNHITSAAILNTRLVAVSLVNTDSEVTSYLMVFDVKSPEPISGIELSGTLLFEVFPDGRRIFTTGDNSISAMDEYCDVVYDKRFDNVTLTHAANDENGNRIVVFSQQNIPALNLYNKNGDQVYSYSIENNPDHVDVYKTTVLYNNGRDIICGKVNSEDKYLYTAPMDIKGLLLINSRTYMIIYENSVEMIRI